MLLTLTFMVVEAAGGVISGSLALLADAGHMLSDASAILLALGAVWLSRQETTLRRTFGFRRAEFLAAFVNAIALVALAVWIVFEAVERMAAPRPVLGGLMLAVATAGLVVNLVGILLLRRHAASSLSIKSALWHLSGDLLGSIGAVSAAVVIQLTGWTRIDPLLSLAIAALIGAAGGRILYDSANLLMDRVPKEYRRGGGQTLPDGLSRRAANLRPPYLGRQQQRNHAHRPPGGTAASGSRCTVAPAARRASAAL